MTTIDNIGINLAKNEIAVHRGNATGKVALVRTSTSHPKRLD